MKKVLLIAVVMGLTSYAFSQTIGAKVGVNFNTVSLSEGDDFPDGAELGDNVSGTGFHIGGYASFELSDNINFRPELLFTQRSTSEDIDITTTTEAAGVQTEIKETGESDNTYSYLSIPLLVEYKLNDNLGIHVGPVVSLLMGANASFESNTTTTTTSPDGPSSTTESSVSGESDSTDGLNGLNLDLGIGAIYELESGLNFGARYNLGLNSINEETKFSKSSWGVFQVSVGYAFVKP